jgi:G:T-mismatch repair DNA endonuclease (very short patch repair protein)
MLGKNSTTGETQYEAYKRTMKQEHDLKLLGYNVRTIWGCEFKELLAMDPEAKSFVRSLDIQDRLDPR